MNHEAKQFNHFTVKWDGATMKTGFTRKFAIPSSKIGVKQIEPPMKSM